MNDEEKQFQDWQYPVSEACLNPLEMFKYVEGSLNPRERARAEAHLASCRACLVEMSSLVQNSMLPAEDDFEKSLLESTPEDIEDQVARILSFVEQQMVPDLEPAETEEIETMPVFKAGRGKVKYTLMDVFQASDRKLKPVTAISTTCLMGLLLFLGLKVLYPQYQIRQARSLLYNSYFSHIEQPRLSGGYRSSATGMLMANEGEEMSVYLEAAESHLRSARRLGQLNHEGLRLLAQIYMLDDKKTAADSIYDGLADKDHRDPGLYNDRGVYYAKQKEWEKAAVQFKRALLVDAEFPEAYYNLALVDIEMHALSEAKILLEMVVEIEKDDIWKRAALHKLTEISSIQETE